MAALRRHIETIGERIRALRVAAGLSQAELAQIVGMTQSAISKLENGLTYHVDLRALKIMATLFHVSVAYLMDGTPPGTPSEPGACEVRPHH